MYWTNSVPGTDGSWEVITSKTKAPKWNKYQVYPKDGIYVTYNN